MALVLCGVRGTAAEAVYPVENGRNWFSRHIGTRVRGLFTRMDLAVENRRLKEENAALRMELSSSRQAPGTKHQALGTNWISAPVLSRNGAAGVSGYLRVGKGSLAGVKPGAAVAVPEGLVGRVLTVTPHTCDVRLVIDPRHPLRRWRHVRSRRGRCVHTLCRQSFSHSPPAAAARSAAARQDHHKRTRRGFPARSCCRLPA